MHIQSGWANEWMNKHKVPEIQNYEIKNYTIEERWAVNESSLKT